MPIKAHTNSVKPLRAVGTFFLIFLPITGFFEYAVVNWNYGGWITGMMWSVGVSAILTCVAIGRPIASLGWGWGKTKYQLAALLIPVFYAGLSCGFLWITGLAHYDPAYVHKYVSEYLGMPFVPGALMPIVLIVVVGFTSIATAVSSGLGEEIGWRGFLAPELAKAMPFIVACLVTGIIWGLWHFPIVFGGNYGAANGLTAFDGVKFVTTTTLATVPMTYLRLRSGSLWTAAIFHGSHNLFLNGILLHMVAAGPGKKLVGELGWITMACMAIVAGICWWRSRTTLAGGKIAMPA